MKKLTAEFCISSTLHHPNIVETVDLVQDENQHWCEVMEFCPGGDLYAAIKKGWMHFFIMSSMSWYPFFLHWGHRSPFTILSSYFLYSFPFMDLQLMPLYRGMSPSEAECCFKQILHGISYLHSQGVAHRDIKPENLFFDTKGHLKVSCHSQSFFRPKLTDFLV